VQIRRSHPKNPNPNPTGEAKGGAGKSRALRKSRGGQAKEERGCTFSSLGARAKKIGTPRTRKGNLSIQECPRGERGKPETPFVGPALRAREKGVKRGVKGLVSSQKEEQKDRLLDEEATLGNGRREGTTNRTTYSDRGKEEGGGTRGLSEGIEKKAVMKGRREQTLRLKEKEKGPRPHGMGGIEKLIKNKKEETDERFSTEGQGLLHRILKEDGLARTETPPWSTYMDASD